MFDSQSINLNDFKIIKNIDDGQFGAVYLVESQDTHKKYAAKVIKHECNTENDQNSFSNDINFYLKIKNPAILNILGYSLKDFDQKPFPTLIADYAENGSLKKVFDDSHNSNFPNNLTNTNKYIILLGITLGMKYLHSLGIMHRNLKPCHILLDENYYPLITDFLYSNTSDEQLTKIILESNSPSYIAPEVFLGNPYTYKSDIYSFSLIAYELVTGKKPYLDFKNIDDLKEAITHGKRPDLSLVPNGKIRSFLSKCWSEKPSDRPSFNQIFKEISKFRYKLIFDANQNYEKVTQYLELFSVGEEYQNQKNLENNQDLMNKSDSGDANSMLKYGIMLRNGEGAPICKEKAAQYFEKASELGNVDAMYIYAVMLRDGEGIPVNKEKAAQYFKKAADLGNEKAMNNYGVMLCDGDGVSIDKKEAAKYIKMSAEHGNSDAMNNYANMLRNGEGIIVDKKEASRYYKLSAEKGNSSAMFNYAGMLHEADGIPRDKEEEIKYIKMAADLGNDYAMYNYAMMRRDGEYLEEDKQEAARYFKMCAESGNPNAMFNYASMLHEGDGIPVNKEEAANYYKCAAELGNSNAMFNYAGILHLGDGVPVDDKKAAEYLKKSAELGNEDALLLCQVYGCSIY